MPNGKANDGKIDLVEHYKLAIAQHNEATQLRVKIIQGWLLSYAALGAAFAWAQSVSPPISWTIPFAGIGVTLWMWSADIRNRDGFNDWRRIGASIEREAQLPEAQCYFVAMENRGVDQRPPRVVSAITHGQIIDYSARIIITALAFATFWLAGGQGALF